MAFYKLLKEAKVDTLRFLARQTGSAQESKNLTEVEKLYDLERLLKEDDLPYDDRQQIFIAGGVCFEKLQYLAGIKNYLQPFAKFRVQQFADLKAAMAGKTYKEIIDSLRTPLPKKPSSVQHSPTRPPPLYSAPYQLPNKVRATQRSPTKPTLSHPAQIHYHPPLNPLSVQPSYQSGYGYYHYPYQYQPSWYMPYSGQPGHTPDPSYYPHQHYHTYPHPQMEPASPVAAADVYGPVSRPGMTMQGTTTAVPMDHSATPISSLRAKAPSFNISTDLRIDSNDKGLYSDTVEVVPGTGTPPELESDTHTLPELDDSPVTVKPASPPKVIVTPAASKASIDTSDVPRVQLPTRDEKYRDRLLDPFWKADAAKRFAEIVAHGYSTCRLPFKLPKSDPIPPPEECIPGLINHFEEAINAPSVMRCVLRDNVNQCRTHGRSELRRRTGSETGWNLDDSMSGECAAREPSNEGIAVTISQFTLDWLITDDRPGTVMVRAFQRTFKDHLIYSIMNQKGLTAANHPANPNRIRYTDMEVANELMPRLAGAFLDLAIQRDEASAAGVLPPPGLGRAFDRQGWPSRFGTGGRKRRMVFNRYAETQVKIPERKVLSVFEIGKVKNEGNHDEDRAGKTDKMGDTEEEGTEEEELTDEGTEEEEL